MALAGKRKRKAAPSRRIGGGLQTPPLYEDTMQAPKYNIQMLGMTNTPNIQFMNKLNELSFVNNLKLVSTYTCRILGDDYLYGIFEVLE